MKNKMRCVLALVALFAFSLSLTVTLCSGASADHKKIICCVGWCNGIVGGDTSHTGWFDTSYPGDCNPNYNPEMDECLYQAYLCATPD